MATETAVDVLAHFANFKLAGDRYVRDAVSTLRHSRAAAGGQGPRLAILRRPRRRRYGRRRGRMRRVGAMTDAELEAELQMRRLARARERERYARAMRAEKLNALESELSKLRTEIARIQPRPRAALGGTPPVGAAGSLGGQDASRRFPAGSAAPGIPPPPPPMPPLGDPNAAYDPEKQKREKEERQRRREQKRKEREAAKKPLTLADIIRGAGPNPMKRLKPKTPKPGLFDDPDVVHGFVTAKEKLKKVEKNEDEEGSPKDTDKKEEVAENEKEKKQIAEGSESEKASSTNDKEQENDETDCSKNTGRTTKNDDSQEDSSETKKGEAANIGRSNTRTDTLTGNPTSPKSNVKNDNFSGDANGPGKENEKKGNPEHSVENETNAVPEVHKDAQLLNNTNIRPPSNQAGRKDKEAKSNVQVGVDSDRVRAHPKDHTVQMNGMSSKENVPLEGLPGQRSLPTKSPSRSMKDLANQKATLLAAREKRRRRKLTTPAGSDAEAQREANGKANKGEDASKIPPVVDIAQLFGATNALNGPEYQGMEGRGHE